MEALEVYINEIVTDKLCEEYGKDLTFAIKLWKEYGKNITEAVESIIDTELEYLCDKEHELSHVKEQEDEN